MNKLLFLNTYNNTRKEIAKGIEQHFTNSESLTMLGKKLAQMVELYRGHDIEPMLRSILTGRIKVWSMKWETKGKRNKRREKKERYDVRMFRYKNVNSYCEGEEQDFIVGHFRYNGVGYILSEEDMKFVQQYFSL